MKRSGLSEEQIAADLAFDKHMRSEALREKN